MIKLFDWLTPETIDLHFSLNEAGFEGLSVVVNDDGCLPEGVTSPYSYFCEMASGQGKPCYFNQVCVPEFWEITGTNSQAEIWNRGQKMAAVYYHDPKHLRLVKTVEWLSHNGKVYLAEHYNQYGWIFAKTYFDAEQKASHKKYYNQKRQEILTENLLTGDILLNWQGQIYHFDRKAEFFRFYFKTAAIDTSAIWYNTLSLPFLISYYLGGEGDDILFWQEKIGNQIPGNMRVILEGRAHRTKRIIVQDKESYDHLLTLISPEQALMVSYLGYIIPELRQNQNRKTALILTNSDHIEGLETLLSELPDYHFHIAALTEMSQRLHSYASQGKVTLYPNASARQIDKLFENCDLYLDINHGSEIVNGVRCAFENNLLIAGFSNTLHQQHFLMKESIFDPSQPQALAKWIKSQENLAQTVRVQRSAAGQETVERYQQVLS